MAEDARISTGFPRHHKTVKLKRRLGTEGCWALLCLFLWVSDNRCDGDLRGMCDEDVEIAAEWGGDAGALTKTLVEVGFLDGAEGTYSVHDWATHNPWAADRGRRIQVATRASLARWGRGRQAAPNTETDAEMPSPSVVTSTGMRGALPPPTHIPYPLNTHALAEHVNTSAHPSAEPVKKLLSVPTDKRYSKAQLEEFAAEVYSSYPRRVGKGDALKAITKAINAVASTGHTEKHPDFCGDPSLAKEWLKSRTLAFAESPQGRRTDTQFIPYPATWFNGGRYDDDETEWCRVSTANSKSRSRPTTYTETQDPSEGFEEIISRPRPVWAVEKHQ